jgi:hypothetical protein
MWRAKALELNNFGVCTTWGKKDKYQIHLSAARVSKAAGIPGSGASDPGFGFPLASNILIEDKTSGKTTYAGPEAGWSSRHYLL